MISWLFVEFSATTVWLPEANADELAVDVGSITVAGPEDRAWEPGALVPAGGWSGFRAACEPREVAAAFRVERDVALVKLGRETASLARLGAVDYAFGVLRDVPHMATQTTHGPGGRRLGLHLDNWDRLPAGRRHASRNRANLNLGPEPRWFLFLDFDVVGAHPADAVPDTASSRALVGARTPSPRVVRLRVPPGWAYIAPTENLLHDSSSLGQDGGSSHTSALGQFNPPIATGPPASLAGPGAGRAWGVRVVGVGERAAATAGRRGGLAASETIAGADGLQDPVDPRRVVRDQGVT